MSIFSSKKGQWTHIISRETRSLERQNRILFTSYLMERGYKNPFFISRFWGISVNTAKAYMKEAKHVTLSDGDKEKIEKIKKKKGCSLPDAVAMQYSGHDRYAGKILCCLMSLIFTFFLLRYSITHLHYGIFLNFFPIVFSIFWIRAFYLIAIKKRDLGQVETLLYIALSVFSTIIVASFPL
jgi:hypothetical protein